MKNTYKIGENLFRFCAVLVPSQKHFCHIYKRNYFSFTISSRRIVKRLFTYISFSLYLFVYVYAVKCENRFEMIVLSRAAELYCVVFR